MRVGGADLPIGLALMRRTAAKVAGQPALNLPAGLAGDSLPASLTITASVGAGQVACFVGAACSVAYDLHVPSAAAEPSSGSQTIMRALGILGALRDADSDVGVSELARAVELPVSTVHRILRTLVVAGYVVQNLGTDRYRLGREAFLLGRAAGHTLGFDAALPLLQRLSDETGESVNLVVRDRDQGLVVLRVESPQPLRFAQPAGTRIPLHSTSSGKVLLAFAPPSAGDPAALAPLPQHTPATISSVRKLAAELAQIRERGYSVNKGEHIAGVFGVAAPVLEADGTALAALAVQGPDARMPDSLIPELAIKVVRTAGQIVSLLPSGYHI